MKAWSGDAASRTIFTYTIDCYEEIEAFRTTEYRQNVLLCIKDLSEEEIKEILAGYIFEMKGGNKGYRRILKGHFRFVKFDYLLFVDNVVIAVRTPIYNDFIPHGNACYLRTDFHNLARAVISQITGK